jgi:hypothetical protein
MRIDFLTPGDPFRVVAGAAPISDDLDPAVLFSSKYRGAVAESFQTTFGAGGSGTFYFSRTYPAIPLVLAAAYSTAQGIIVPYGYVYGVRTGTGTYSSSYRYLLLEATQSYCSFFSGNNIYGETLTLKLWVIG